MTGVFLRATAVTRGWNEYRNKSQHRKLTLEKKILPPLQQGFEPATFRSRDRRSNHWAVPAPMMKWCNNHSRWRKEKERKKGEKKERKKKGEKKEGKGEKKKRKKDRRSDRKTCCLMPNKPRKCKAGETMRKKERTKVWTKERMKQKKEGKKVSLVSRKVKLLKGKIF